MSNVFSSGIQPNRKVAQFMSLRPLNQDNRDSCFLSQKLGSLKTVYG